MIRISLVVLALLLAAGGAADAGCSVPRFGFRGNQTSDAQMYVSKGGPCSINVYAGGRSRFDGISIPVRPRNGTVSARSVGVTYRPRAGFIGDDAFVFAVKGQFADGPGTATVRVSVTIK